MITALTFFHTATVCAVIGLLALTYGLASERPRPVQLSLIPLALCALCVLVLYGGFVIA